MILEYSFLQSVHYWFGEERGTATFLFSQMERGSERASFFKEDRGEKCVPKIEEE